MSNNSSAADLPKPLVMLRRCWQPLIERMQQNPIPTNTPDSHEIRCMN
ncbi:hypothetical protein [Leptolyngbya sp. FACHB-671]|nr:hypothetical protein [Leptolyngbya sp. FACHB-671]